MGDDQRDIVEQLDYSRGNKLQGAHFYCALWSPPFKNLPYRATPPRRARLTALKENEAVPREQLLFYYILIAKSIAVGL